MLKKNRTQDCSISQFKKGPDLGEEFSINELKAGINLHNIRNHI